MRRKRELGLGGANKDKRREEEEWRERKEDFYIQPLHPPFHTVTKNKSSLKVFFRENEYPTPFLKQWPWQFSGSRFPKKIQLLKERQCIVKREIADPSPFFLLLFWHLLLGRDFSWERERDPWGESANDEKWSLLARGKMQWCSLDSKVGALGEMKKMFFFFIFNYWIKKFFSSLF